jgi:hypothetical protein
MRQQDSNVWFSLLIGFTAGAMTLLLLATLCDKSPADVYQRAYIDMQEGKIGSVVKNKYPNLWRKYNSDGEILERVKKLEGKQREELQRRLDKAEKDGYHERDSTYDPIMGMHTWGDRKKNPPECPECGDTMITCFDDDDLWWCYECFIVHPKKEKTDG